MKILGIEDVFAKYSAYYIKIQRRIKKRLKQIKELPRGVFIKKNIRGHWYYYLAYRQKEKVIFKYIGKNKPLGLASQVQQRKDEKKLFTKKLMQVEDALYVLGITRRIPRGNVVKRFEVFKRDNFRCKYCGRSVKEHDVVLSIDHVIPKKRGGTEDLSNLVTACLTCNIGKHKHLLNHSLFK